MSVEIFLPCDQLCESIPSNCIVLERDEVEVDRRQILERCRRASQLFDEAVQDCLGVLLGRDYLEGVSPDDLVVCSSVCERVRGKFQLYRGIRADPSN